MVVGTPAYCALAVAALLIAAPAAAGDPRYFGLQIPEQAAEPFRPAIFDQLGVLVPTHPTFSGDYRRFVFATVNAETPAQIATAIFESRFDGRAWSKPAFVRNLHTRGFGSSDPAFSRDGRFLYFTSTRPPGSPPWNGKVFRARVTADGYEEATFVDLALAASAPTSYPQMAANGDLFFTSNALPGAGLGDLYVAERHGEEGFALPKQVRGAFNSEHEDWDLVEHPRGHLRLWASGRPDGVGDIDLYVGVRQSDDSWSAPLNLRAVNTPGIETAPRLSPDGEVLFFQRFVNGREQIFWVRLASVLPTGL